MITEEIQLVIPTECSLLGRLPMAQFQCLDSTFCQPDKLGDNNLNFHIIVNVPSSVDFTPCFDGEFSRECFFNRLGEIFRSDTELHRILAFHRPS